jgi:hypothetical protein
MPDTPAAQLEGFFARFDPKLAALGRKALAYLKKRLPGSIITVYDNYNALAIGFGPHGKASTTPISIALYPRWINLFFLQGAKLDDPKKLLKGSGAIVRTIRLDSMDIFEDEDVDALISAAVMHVGWRLDPKAKGQMEIRAISKKQRPRRI